MSALSALAAEGGEQSVPLAFCILTPASWAAQDRAWLRDNVASDGDAVVPQRDEPFPLSVVPDEVVTHLVAAPTLVETQRLALARHATQVVVHQGYYTLSNHVATRLSGREGFARFDPVAGQLVPGPPGAPPRRGLQERDLFSEDMWSGWRVSDEPGHAGR
jgi:N-acetyl-1-D-myo-inositol-2-amino-2-deoxy-alpha-D-glucopyranoside deacetylase